MAIRANLQKAFLELTKNVYFQPPVGIVMQYPAIRYSVTDINNTFADDGVYKQDRIYEVTVIDKDPLSPIVDAVSRMPGCRFNRHYDANGLNHDVFIIS